MRTTETAPRGLRGRAALAASLLLALVLGASAVPTQPTDAAWISEEAGTLTATAGSVAAPDTTCTGRSAAPNLLTLTPPDEGLEVTAYRVTVLVQDGDGTVPGGWQSGTTSEGYPLLPANTPTVVPASTTAVAWGISGDWNNEWKGIVTVEALGPGGWSSQSVQHDWTIGFDWLGIGYGTCT
ncbi:hypothetical protein [Brachybacterium sp. YJGR34]|uniref:hypothetical protein n=1 Tax=Brachybacterium sp. YJGR34 TaxID=2059911 RepID=UPI000E0A17AE|nr:hypothetical protein [Brachybacterium sp. YJGR34]